MQCPSGGKTDTEMIRHCEISLPYGKGHISVSVPEKNLACVMHSKLASYESEKTQEALVEEALAHPHGSLPLCERVKGRKKVVVISSDHTRPVPSRLLMPRILREIRKGSPDAEITILIATGCHRAPTEQELLERYGEEIVRSERIAIHNADDDSSLVDLGPMASGNRLLLNKIAHEADFLMAEGFIEPHFFAGFSGGRKAVLPGVVGRATTMFNHCADNIDHSHARTGVLADNPIHADMCEGAKKAGLAFILNVVLNDRKEVIGAFSGDPEPAHEAGIAFIKSLCRCKAVPADIVITTNGGYPLDQNIYQAVKGMSTAEMTCRPGGVIIMASQCSDGHGAPAFYETFALEPSNEAIMTAIRSRSAEKTLPDQWQSQIFLRILQNFRVIFVSSAPREMVENLHMIYSPTMEDALSAAFALCGEDASVTVIPDGVSTLVESFCPSTTD